MLRKWNVLLLLFATEESVDSNGKAGYASVTRGEHERYQAAAFIVMLSSHFEMLPGDVFPFAGSWRTRDVSYQVV